MMQSPRHPCTGRTAAQYIGCSTSVCIHGRAPYSSRAQSHAPPPERLAALSQVPKPHLNCGVSSGAPPVKSTTLTLPPPPAAALALPLLSLPLPVALVALVPLLVLLLQLASMSATHRSATSRLIISVRLQGGWTGVGVTQTGEGHSQGRDTVRFNQAGHSCQCACMEVGQGVLGYS